METCHVLNNIVPEDSIGVYRERGSTGLGTGINSRITFLLSKPDVGWESPKPDMGRESPKPDMGRELTKPAELGATKPNSQFETSPNSLLPKIRINKSFLLLFRFSNRAPSNTIRLYPSSGTRIWRTAEFNLSACLGSQNCCLPEFEDGMRGSRNYRNTAC
ncbi:hypothetical protein L6452_34022 [Arctium lappa]|uniref:Uncharacterized protein n=1 Tax=Arctium lappa TaxID=4217 RepID=A0ACB8YHQ6_ARCLA|nr:hypothetical protein L6452_34022 [Arctium lappa]